MLVHYWTGRCRFLLACLLPSTGRPASSHDQLGWAARRARLAKIDLRKRKRSSSLWRKAYLLDKEASCWSGRVELTRTRSSHADYLRALACRADQPAVCSLAPNNSASVPPTYNLQGRPLQLKLKLARDDERCRPVKANEIELMRQRVDEKEREQASGRLLANCHCCRGRQHAAINAAAAAATDDDDDKLIGLSLQLLLLLLLKLL